MSGTLQCTRMWNGSRGLLLKFFGHLVRPLSSAMQHPQNAHLVAGNSIGCDIRCAINDQFARIDNTARTAHLGELRQPLYAHLNPIVDRDRSPWAVHLDCIEDRFTIRKCKDRPFQPHWLTLPLFHRRRLTLGKLCFHLFVRNAWARVIERLLHFCAEPCVVFSCSLG